MKVLIFISVLSVFYSGFGQSYKLWQKGKNTEYKNWSVKQNWSKKYFHAKKKALSNYERRKQEAFNKFHGKPNKQSLSAQQEVDHLENELAAAEERGSEIQIAKLQTEINRLRQENLNLTQQINVKTFKTWAVVVGVADYRDKGARLNYCDDDAYRIYAFLKSPEGGALPDNQIILLIDEKAHSTTIKKAFVKMLRQAGPEDAFLFYFSGHGSPDALLAENFTPSTGLGLVSHQFIGEQLKTSKAKLTLCIIDACHSGNLAIHQPNPQTQEIYVCNASKALHSGDKTIKSLETTQLFYETLNQTQKGSAFILSSKGEEYSLEIQGKRQGAFSYFFIKGLSGHADYNKDKIISITECFDYTRKEVIKFTRNAQTPVITGDYAHTMPLGLVR